MDSTRVTLLGIIGALGAVLGIMEYVLPIPIGLILMYVFQENRKEVAFSVLSGKLVLLLGAILCYNLFYVVIFIVTSVDEMAGVIVFSRATCINNKTLVLTGTVAALFQNSLTFTFMSITTGTLLPGGGIDMIKWLFVSGAFIPIVIMASLLHGFCFISVFGAVRDVLDNIRAVIIPYTGKIQELNNLVDYE